MERIRTVRIDCENGQQELLHVHHSSGALLENMEHGECGKLREVYFVHDHQEILVGDLREVDVAPAGARGGGTGPEDDGVTGPSRDDRDGGLFLCKCGGGDPHWRDILVVREILRWRKGRGSVEKPGLQISQLLLDELVGGRRGRGRGQIWERVGGIHRESVLELLSREYVLERDRGVLVILQERKCVHKELSSHLASLLKVIIEEKCLHTISQSQFIDTSPVSIVEFSFRSDTRLQPRVTQDFLHGASLQWILH